MSAGWAIVAVVCVYLFGLGLFRVRWADAAEKRFVGDREFVLGGAVEGVREDAQVLALAWPIVLVCRPMIRAGERWARALRSAP